MYIPPPFLVTDRETICDFIERSPFATLVSATGGVPAVSHLPLFLDEKTSRADNDSEPHRGDEDGALHLLGHFARENSHCERADGQNVLAVFHGPHSYISPAWYKSKNVVPTWNYQAVHATGTLELIEDPVAMLHLLSRTVDQFESSRELPWSLESPSLESPSLESPETDFIQELMRGIVGFRIRINQLEAKWKLSQNHPPERREKVIEALEAIGDPQALGVASEMRKLTSGK
jgi:transcriptional regulator